MTFFFQMNTIRVTVHLESIQSASLFPNILLCYSVISKLIKLINFKKKKIYKLMTA